jgi:CxxC motif-containing protein (DUF1111 family)
MNSLKAVAFLALGLAFLGCSTSPPETSSRPAAGPRAPPARAQSGRPQPAPAPHILEAPVGFGGSNGVVDDQTYQGDQGRFEALEVVASGLGPLYNAQSCRECHQSTATGGASQVTELRVGHKGRNGRFQFPEIAINHGSEVIAGRSLVNQRAICPSDAFPDVELLVRVPDTETIRTLRLSNSTLGSGFVEAVDDATLTAIADGQCKQWRGEICGLALRVPVLEAPGQTRVGRFGWKSQHASLLSFSADAYLNEIGVTNRLLPDEVTRLCNTVREPNDAPGPDGQSNIDRFARFMRATKAPARDARVAGTPEAQAGQQLFSGIGCAGCHAPTLQTAPPGTVINGGAYTVPEALGNKAFHPYSDYLLHDVGTGDGISPAMVEHYGKQVYKVQWQGLSLQAFDAAANRIRTAPLWGVRTRPLLMHDAASLTMRDAIVRHRGEAARVSARFSKLSQSDQNAVLTFLSTL